LLGWDRRTCAVGLKVRPRLRASSVTDGLHHAPPTASRRPERPGWRASWALSETSGATTLSSWLAPGPHSTPTRRRRAMVPMSTHSTRARLSRTPSTAASGARAASTCRATAAGLAMLWTGPGSFASCLRPLHRFPQCRHCHLHPRLCPPRRSHRLHPHLYPPRRRRHRYLRLYPRRRARI